MGSYEIAREIANQRQVASMVGPQPEPPSAAESFTHVSPTGFWHGMNYPAGTELKPAPELNEWHTKEYAAQKQVNPGYKGWNAGSKEPYSDGKSASWFWAKHPSAPHIVNKVHLWNDEHAPK